MALRPLRNATISFRLVNIPVRFYTATKSEDVSFNLLHSREKGAGESGTWGEDCCGREKESRVMKSQSRKVSKSQSSKKETPATAPCD